MPRFYTLAEWVSQASSDRVGLTKVEEPCAIADHITIVAFNGKNERVWSWDSECYFCLHSNDGGPQVQTQRSHFRTCTCVRVLTWSRPMAILIVHP